MRKKQQLQILILLIFSLLQTGNKKDAERIVKNIIKIVIKIAVLNKNDQFNAEELRLADKFQSKFHNLQMTIISFHEVDFSFDLKFLQNILSDLRQMLQSLVKRHLTDKSHNRIDEVFDFFNEAQFLEAIFRQNSPYRELMNKIVADINTALESGTI